LLLVVAAAAQLSAAAVAQVALCQVRLLLVAVLF
jgi:hypothetical protein